ncbi:hypothetical protein IFO70_29185 [Phormidium tenue FACHB-886]|nr:hypothetical protein [Phormidium tenue FACHB-886]
MPDVSFTDKSKITEIINTSSRLKYLLKFRYELSLDDIVSVRVDGHNFKVDVITETDMFRFKAKDMEHVILKNPEHDVLQSVFDPALAQAIYHLIDEYAC